MKRLVIGLLSVVVALAVPIPAAANPPVVEPFAGSFTDTNPCSGADMTVTLAGIARVHEHGERVIAIEQTTLTTSDGFEGHGVVPFVSNGNVAKFTLNDTFTNQATGQRFRAHTVIVVDLATDTVRVEIGTLTCLGR